MTKEVNLKKNIASWSLSFDGKVELHPKSQLLSATTQLKPLSKKYIAIKTNHGHFEKQIIMFKLNNKEVLANPKFISKKHSWTH